MSHHANEKAPQVYNGVSEADVPSARFGWSEPSRRSIQTAGWISVLVLLAYNFGNHRGHVETIWLLVLAALIAIGLILHATQPKLNQVRTVTSHNKPLGHQEPDWAYDQKTLSGVYEGLGERELRALNIDPARVAHLRAPQQVAPKHAATERVVAPARETERVKVAKVAPREDGNRTGSTRV